MDAVIAHTARALDLLDALTDAAHADPLAAWSLVADPATVTDDEVRAAVTVAISAALSQRGVECTADSPVPSGRWWALMAEFVDCTLGEIVEQGESLPVVHRPELEPVAWSARILLWLLALAYVIREQQGLGGVGEAP